MRQKIVAGNWKMNLTNSEAEALFEGLLNAKDQWPVNVKVLIAPPSVYLKSWASKSGIAMSSQDCSAHAKGAYTGELSAAQLKSVGASYSLVGHSERRAYHKESGELLAAKTDQCLKNGLIPIYCFGEELEQREADQHEATVKRQIEESLFHLTSEDFDRVILAYEPVWAIGTGKTATASQAQEMHAFVRQVVASKYGDEVGENTSIIYGGSCKPSNAVEIFAGADVDGGLIGGASLKAEDFTAIINARA